MKTPLGATLRRRCGAAQRKDRDKASVTATTDAAGAAEPDDAALIRRIAEARDKEAFSALFRRYAGKIRGALVKAGARPDEADEAAQEAMLAVWRKAGSFDPARAPASAWIFAIARNRRIDMIRRSRRPEPDPEDPLFQPEPPRSAAAAIAERERDGALAAPVAARSEPQRDGVRRAFFVGLGHPEIAARLGLPLGTVKSRLRLAGERLRAALGAEFAREMFDE